MINQNSSIFIAISLSTVGVLFFVAPSFLGLTGIATNILNFIGFIFVMLSGLTWFIKK